MASFSSCSELFTSLAISAIIISIIIPCALATDYVVGDKSGWTVGVDYQAWAQGKQFFVGDTLIFRYQRGSHNVFKVNGTEFQQCRPLADEKPFESGNDIIPLIKSGRKWYFCGVNLHCEAGQKLVITVLDQAPAPGAPSPLPNTVTSPSEQSPRPSPTIPQTPLPNATSPPPPSPSGATKAAVSGHLRFMAMAFGILAVAVAVITT